MFELTNEQRKCFAIPPVLDSWIRVEVKAGPYDDYTTYAFLEGRRIVKVIQFSEKPTQELYCEYGVDQVLSEDGTKILPKTQKGKPQNFTAPNLIKKTPIGMAFSFSKDSISVINHTTDQCYYRSSYTLDKLDGFCDLSLWLDKWCRNSGEKELADIYEFSKQVKTHQKFKEGDFFRYKIDRGLFGYGRILVNYDIMRKDGIPFWDAFMGKPLCVAVYHIVTEDDSVRPEQLVNLKMLPAQMIMDNIFYYGECKIIGHMPIAPDENNYTVHYGRSLDIHNSELILYQSGKTFATRNNAKLLFGGFQNSGIGWDLDVELPILLECINKNSNKPYWNMIRSWKANSDLRNPKFEKELEKVKKQMGIR